MILRTLVLAFAVALLASMAWRFRDADVLRAWLQSERSAPKPIVFDNGTVRTYAPPGSQAEAAPPLAGGPRKCKRGPQVLYTDGTCPPGSQEVPITGGTVTTVPGSTAPAPPAGAGPQAQRRSTVYDVVEPAAQESLRDKRMERMLNP